MNDQDKKIPYVLHLPNKMVKALEKYAMKIEVAPNVIVEEVMGEFLEDKYDEKYDPELHDVIEHVIQFREYGTGHLQRFFNFGYARSQRVLQQLTDLGYLEKKDSGTRKVLKHHLVQ